MRVLTGYNHGEAPSLHLKIWVFGNFVSTIFAIQTTNTTHYLMDVTGYGEMNTDTLEKNYCQVRIWIYQMIRDLLEVFIIHQFYNGSDGLMIYFHNHRMADSCSVFRYPCTYGILRGAMHPCRLITTMALRYHIAFRGLVLWNGSGIECMHR